jgi:hypothetical protein
LLQNLFQSQVTMWDLRWMTFYWSRFLYIFAWVFPPNRCSTIALYAFVPVQ